MPEIKTRAKFGSNKQETQSQTTADNAPELDVNEQATSNNEFSNTDTSAAVSQNNTAKPNAQTQPEVNDTPAHHNEQANLNLRPKPEVKSKRVALLMKESIYKQLKGRASLQARSVNDLVNALVEAYLSQPDA
ncbi:MAG: hypothetical protein II870_04520 [Synergistaceae bacterium]|nr:hypothetical protein [Synergistaceae bacterium]MBR0221359.1 hypothetical protein [Synergistaceae bacterium]